MPSLGLLLREGHVRCYRCFSQYPETLPECPACTGLVQDEHDHFVAPASPEVSTPESAEGQLLLFPNLKKKGSQ